MAARTVFCSYARGDAEAVRGRIQVRDSARAGVPRVAVGVQLALPNGFTAPCQMLRTDVSSMSVGAATSAGWLFGAVRFS